MHTLNQVKKLLIKWETCISQLLTEMKLLKHQQQTLQLALAGSGGREVADKLLTAQETADLLKVTLRTLKNWEQKGELLPVFIGGHRYYRESQFFGFK